MSQILVKGVILVKKKDWGCINFFSTQNTKPLLVNYSLNFYGVWYLTKWYQKTVIKSYRKPTTMLDMRLLWSSPGIFYKMLHWFITDCIYYTSLLEYFVMLNTKCSLGQSRSLKLSKRLARKYGKITFPYKKGSIQFDVTRHLLSAMEIL